MDETSIEQTRANSFGRGTGKSGFLMQGKKKEATTKKVPEKTKKGDRSNNDMAKSLKSMSSN